MNKEKFKGILITMLAAALFIPSLAVALICVIMERVRKRTGSYVGEGQPYPRIK